MPTIWLLIILFKLNFQFLSNIIPFIDLMFSLFSFFLYYQVPKHRKVTENNVTPMYLLASMNKSQHFAFFFLKEENFTDQTQVPMGPFLVSFHHSFLSSDHYPEVAVYHSHESYIFLWQMLTVPINKTVQLFTL